jgi:chromosome segregation ATPase
MASLVAEYKSGYHEMTKKLNEQEAKHKELTGKLNEMFNALKILQAEKQSVASDLEKAEARIQVWKPGT